MDDEQIEFAERAIKIIYEIDGHMEKIAHNLGRIEEHMEQIEKNTRR
jgi:hypothetical protein